jgi:hypothetical protein
MAEMDALLRFGSAALEARFWASAPVRSALLRTDKAAVFFVFANTCSIAYFLDAILGDTLALKRLVMWTLFLVVVQLAACWCVQRAIEG